jgi:2-oxoglutarate dehydrogenase E1 component
MFHLLRRQVLRPYRKPLVVLTPKSLLRHPACVARVEELERGRFQRVLPDGEPPPAPDAVRRVFLCSGKLYYELVDERRRRADAGTAIVRLEQLYPWRDDELARALAAWPKAAELLWVQDEPHNMGAWFFVEPRLRRLFPKLGLRAVTRPESASPATGSSKAHAIVQRALMEEAFGARAP